MYYEWDFTSSQGILFLFLYLLLVGYDYHLVGEECVLFSGFFFLESRNNSDCRILVKKYCEPFSHGPYKYPELKEYSNCIRNCIRMDCIFLDYLLSGNKLLITGL